jgi:LysR family nitrogen assimilation transcriptional regulator
MDFRQLESFLRVAELGSFTRAAATLDVPQPSLSRHVRLLEVELREHLLLRTGRGVELTEAGKCLQAHGTAIVEATRLARQELRALRGKLMGKVALGIPTRIALLITPTLVRNFHAAFPEASIAISEGMSTALREDLLIGRIEMALLVDPPATPKLEFIKLFREDMVLCGVPQPRLPLPARLPARELSKYPLIAPSMPNAIRSLVESTCHSRGISLRFVAEVNSVQSMLDLALDRQGFTILPRSAIDPRIHSGISASLISAPRIRNQVVLAYSKQRLLSRLGNATFDLLRSQDFNALLGSVSC